uniref:G-protein coupled receptors family 1 profile domain-containing protein n=1 Tax=Romanomermis culicivorax TaxID=13658 RepID=A0A915HT58_ROMCU
MYSNNNNSSIENCNHTPYDAFGYSIRLFLIMPIVLFGFLSNTFNILIYKHPSMRTSMVNWYLIALTVSDLAILICSFLMLTLPVMTEDMGTLATFNLGVFTQRWVYALAMMAQTCSVGLLVLVSGYRLLGVKYPFLAQRICTPFKVKATTVFVVAFSIFFNIFRFFELETGPCFSTLYSGTGYNIFESDLRKLNLVYYISYMVGAYTLVNFAAPFIFLITTNVIIIKAVHDSYKLRQMMVIPSSAKSSTSKSTETTPNLKASNGKYQTDTLLTTTANCVSCPVSNADVAGTTSSKENKTTIMLIVVVFVFLFSNSLAFINNILEIILRTRNTEDGVQSESLARKVYLRLVEISNLLIVLNSSTNLFIYWAFSKKYRVLLRYYASCRYKLGPMPNNRSPFGTAKTVRNYLYNVSPSSSRRQPKLAITSSARRTPTTKKVITYSDTGPCQTPPTKRQSPDHSGHFSRHQKPSHWLATAQGNRQGTNVAVGGHNEKVAAMNKRQLLLSRSGE